MTSRGAFYLACAMSLFAIPVDAQGGDDVNPAATACAYSFTSGKGVNLFAWCLTTNGNLVKFETPAGQNHQPAGYEGYGVCSASGTHGADYGDFIPVPFGPATVVSGCTTGTSCTISRDTVDGVFRLVQKFTQVSKDKELNIDHTLTNISGATVNDVALVRGGLVGANNDMSDDWADKSARSVWVREVDRIGRTASTLSEHAETYIVIDAPTGCVAFSPVALPAGPGSEFGTRIIYRLGILRNLQKKIVRVQIRRD